MGPYIGESLIQEVEIVSLFESACPLLMYVQVLLLSPVPAFSLPVSLLLLELASFRCELLIGPAHSASPSSSAS
jgi:hypothetical protein